MIVIDIKSNIGWAYIWKIVKYVGSIENYLAWSENIVRLYMNLSINSKILLTLSQERIRKNMNIWILKETKIAKYFISTGLWWKRFEIFNAIMALMPTEH